MKSIFSFCLLFVFALSSCTSTKDQIVKQETDQEIAKAKKEAKKVRTKPRRARRKKKGLARLPAKLQTFKLKKGTPFFAYLHPDGTMHQDPAKVKGWAPINFNKRGQLSWYAKLEPEAGAKLGEYTSFSPVVAVYNAAGGYKTYAEMSVRYLIRRDNKEFEIFRMTLRTSGQSYHVVPLNDREIADQTELKAGDILVLRLVHLRGNGGAIAIGGGAKVLRKLNYLVISPIELSNFYQRLN